MKKRVKWMKILVKTNLGSHIVDKESIICKNGNYYVLVFSSLEKIINVTEVEKELKKQKLYG